MIDLPLMTDPGAAGRHAGSLGPCCPAYFADQRLFCLLSFRMVKISLQHGISGDSTYAFSTLGFMLGGTAFVVTVMAIVSPSLRATWSRSTASSQVGRKFTSRLQWLPPGRGRSRPRSISPRPAFALRLIPVILPTLAWACTKPSHYLLVRNDRLMWFGANRRQGWTSSKRPSTATLADIIVSHQRFIATMQGRTATFSTFSDAQFDEAAFEAQLAGSRNLMMICWYWILKLKARFLSGDYAEALAAADKAKPLLGASAGLIRSSTTSTTPH